MKKLLKEYTKLREEYNILQEENIKYKNIIHNILDPYKLKPNSINKKEFLYKIQKKKCSYCKKKIGIKNMTLEHIIPKSHKGTNSIFNICLCCEPCNNKRENNMNNKHFLSILIERCITNRYWYYPDLSSAIYNQNINSSYI